MKMLKHFAAILIFCFCIAAASAAAQTNEFTYQGKLTDGGASPTAPYDFVFLLCADVSSVPCIGSPVFRSGVSVTAGIFKVSLDFGVSPFVSDTARYLEIHVRPGGSPVKYTRLDPRQPITSAPYSIKALSATSSDSLSSACILCVTDANIQSVDGSKITGTVANAVNAANAAMAAIAGNVTGVVSIANGGTGSETKNFVDLSTNQSSIAGRKTFLDDASFQGGATFNVATVNGALNVGDNLTANQFTGNGSGLTNVPGTFKWQVVSGLAQQAQPNNGYLANDFEQITVTLPPAPNIGDTVRVTGIGAGGWKIAQNKNQSILGLDFDLTGIFWTPREIYQSWTGIASSADGTKLVAVAHFGQIYTSIDSGATWTARENSRRWTSVASSADGTKLIAAVDNGKLYVSGNSGVTWLESENNRDWVSVASSADGTKLVAAVNNGRIYTSCTGGSCGGGGGWTPRDANRNWVSVASSADGTKLVAAVEKGQIYTSTDSGVTWTARESNRNWRAVASSADGAKLVAAEYEGRIYTSTDAGVNWIPRGTGFRLWTAVASSADGTRLIAAELFKGKLFTSTDSGVSWTASGNFNDWSAVATSADGKKSVAVTDFDKIYTSYLLPAETTTLGGTGYLVGGQYASVELQYVGDGLFLPISHKGTIFSY